MPHHLAYLIGKTIADVQTVIVQRPDGRMDPGLRLIFDDGTAHEFILSSSAEGGS